MNDQLIGVDQATHPDGFVDYYAILATAPSTPAEEMREKINALYQEAQTNRDHRSLPRRREYQILLELLPQARTILLDETRRKRYNAYRQAVEMQSPRMAYPEFFESLTRERNAPDSHVDILTIRDLSRLRRATTALDPTGSESAPDNEPITEVKAVTGPTPIAPAFPAPSSPPANEVGVPEETLTTAREATSPSNSPASIFKAATEASETTSAASPPTPAPPSTPSGPISEAHKFSANALLGGAIVLGGMLGVLPNMVGVPIVLTVPLAVLCGGVTAYVFSMTGEVIEN